MEVSIYTTPTCAFCQLAKDFFKEHQIAYKEINVAADIFAAREMIQKTGQMGVPVIIIKKDDGHEETVIGFDEDRLAELLLSSK